MKSGSRVVEWLAWGLLGIVLVSSFAIFVSMRLIRPSRGKLPVLATLPDFTLTNQAGQKVSLDTLRGQIWLADIIFTTCPGPCAKMSQLMSQVQADLPPGTPIKL